MSNRIRLPKPRLNIFVTVNMHSELTLDTTFIDLMRPASSVMIDIHPFRRDNALFVLLFMIDVKASPEIKLRFPSIRSFK